MNNVTRHIKHLTCLPLKPLEVNISLITLLLITFLVNTKSSNYTDCEQGQWTRTVSLWWQDSGQLSPCPPVVWCCSIPTQPHFLLSGPSAELGGRGLLPRDYPVRVTWVDVLKGCFGSVWATLSVLAERIPDLYLLLLCWLYVCLPRGRSSCSSQQGS